MALQTYTGTYSASKASSWWPNVDFSPKTNYERWVTAHSTILDDLPNASSYQSVSYNFSLTAPSTTYAPPDDDTYRQAANTASSGVSDLDGGDFLEKGNYVHPDAAVFRIGSTTVSGKLYYAGSTSSFNPSMGTITRGWLEVISTTNLATAVPLVDGNSYVVKFDDGVKYCVNGVTIEPCPPFIGGIFAWEDGPLTYHMEYWADGHWTIHGACSNWINNSWDGSGTTTFTINAVDPGCPEDADIEVYVGDCQPPFGLPGRYCANAGGEYDLYWDAAISKWTSAPGSPQGTGFELTAPESLPGIWTFLSPPADEYPSDLIWDGGETNNDCMTFFIYTVCTGACEPPFGLGYNYCLGSGLFAWNGFVYSNPGGSYLTPPTSLPGIWVFTDFGVGDFNSDSSWDGTDCETFGGNSYDICEGAC